MNDCSDTQQLNDDAACGSRVVDPAAVARVRASLTDERAAVRTVAIFSALADPTRFRILEALAAEELCVCDLAEVAGISESGVSHQLRLLRDRELVAFRRQGTRAVYRLADDHVRDLLSIGVRHAEEDQVR